MSEKVLDLLAVCAVMSGGVLVLTAVSVVLLIAGLFLVTASMVKQQP